MIAARTLLSQHHHLSSLAVVAKMEKPTPLINSSMLSQHSGRTVRIVGKVEKSTGHTLLITTSDLGTVEVALNQDSDFSGSTYVEVTGKVSEGGSGLDGNQIREFTTVDCGDGVGKCRSTDNADALFGRCS